MLVWEDAGTHEPIAYFWGSLNSTSSILEVRPDRRGQGVGRAFANYLADQSLAKGELLLEVECAPESSASFWRSVGFDVARKDEKLIGRRILALSQVMPEGPKIPVKIRFLPEAALYYNDNRCAPFAVHEIEGVFEPSGRIVLSEKVACFDMDEGYDLVVHLEVAGKEVYFEKAKRQTARSMGVIPCENGYSIAWLNMDEATAGMCRAV
jgi:hypothetical protein